MKRFLVLMTLVAITAAFAVSNASAAMVYPAKVGDKVSFAFGGGNVAGGGQFNATMLTGDFTGFTFGTFCLELNEHLTTTDTNPNAKYWVHSVSAEAVKGGIGGGNPDPISEETKWLYYQFNQESLAGFDGSTDSKSALQLAFWLLEQEAEIVGGQSQEYGGGDKLFHTGGMIAQALAFKAAAEAAVLAGEYTGGVAVMNIVDIYGKHAQSVLIAPVPEPATLALLGVGLVAAGVIRRRSRK